MTVLYYDLCRQPEGVERDLGATFTSLDDLLARSDFITIHVPLLAETKHLMGEREFGLMKPTAYLVNTSRGPVVDEAALVNALTKGQVAGAALDVYEHEPRMAPGLAELPNVVLCPHIASSTVEARTYMAEVAVENIVAFCRGDAPPNLVNPEVLAAVPTLRA